MMEKIFKKQKTETLEAGRGDPPPDKEILQQAGL